MKNKNLHVRLPEELLNEFTKITDKKAINRSELVRRWIENYLEEIRSMNKKYYYGVACPFCGHMNNIKIDPAELPEAELATQCGVCKIVFPFTEEDLSK